MLRVEHDSYFPQPSVEFVSQLVYVVECLLWFLRSSVHPPTAAVMGAAWRTLYGVSPFGFRQLSPSEHELQRADDQASSKCGHQRRAILLPAIVIACPGQRFALVRFLQGCFLPA